MTDEKLNQASNIIEHSISLGDKEEELKTIVKEINQLVEEQRQSHKLFSTDPSYTAFFRAGVLTALSALPTVLLDFQLRLKTLESKQTKSLVNEEANAEAFAKAALDLLAKSTKGNQQ